VVFVLLVKLPLLLIICSIVKMLNAIAPAALFTLLDSKMFSNLQFKGKYRSLDDVPFLFSWEFAKRQIHKQLMDALRLAELGEKAPNVEMIDLETKGKVSLLSLARAGRPLVLNFGSCT